MLEQFIDNKNIEMYIFTQGDHILIKAFVLTRLDTWIIRARYNYLVMEHHIPAIDSILYMKPEEGTYYREYESLSIKTRTAVEWFTMKLEEMLGASIPELWALRDRIDNDNIVVGENENWI